MAYVLVFIGGGIGSVARLLTGNFAQQWWPSDFTVATIIVNILSAFILGLLMTWPDLKPAVYDQYRLLIATGFCGGFSTFSMFTLELFNFAKKRTFWFGVLKYRHQYYNLSCSVMVRNYFDQALTSISLF